MPNKVTIQIAITVPDDAIEEGVTPAMIMSYFRDAVQTMCKSREPPGGSSEESPGDPLFFLSDWPITQKFISEKHTTGFGSSGRTLGSAGS